MRHFIGLSLVIGIPLAVLLFVLAQVPSWILIEVGVAFGMGASVLALWILGLWLLTKDNV